MAVRDTGTAPRSLLERERELAALEAAIDAGVGGDGSVTLIEGPAGIGKTALLDEALRYAARTPSRVLPARPTEVESNVPYGVVRTLFASTVADLPAPEQRRVLGGAARPAASALAPGASHEEVRQPAADPTFAVVQGLYSLTVKLAGREPLVLVVDDLHWADPASVRFLLYLARRLERVRCTVFAALRTGEPTPLESLIGQLAADPRLRRVEPAPLSEDAVRQLVQGIVADDLDAAFVHACHRAAGGNPFLVRELLTALGAEDAPRTAEAIARIEERGVAGVAAAVERRLSRLPPEAAKLADAVAVLGGEVHTRLAARLAGLDEDVAVEAVDVLVEAAILRAELPLAFLHPLVRGAVYGRIAARARAGAHARAAALLAEQGGDDDVVAGHLLLAEPSGDPWVLRHLRAAAASAVARGAPETAAAYLRRALREDLDQPTRSQLLHQLGFAERLSRDPACIDHFREALQLSDDPTARARIAHDLGETLPFLGQWRAATELFESALQELGERDDEPALRLHAIYASVTAYDPELVERFERDLPRLRTLARKPTAGGRRIAVVLAGAAGIRGDDPAEVTALVERGWANGEFLAEETSESVLVAHAFGGAMGTDDLDRAEAMAEEILADSRARSSVFGAIAGFAHRAWARASRGNLAAAEADARAAVELAQEYAMLIVIPVALWYAEDVLLERPSAADLAALLDGVPLDPATVSHGLVSRMFGVRGRLRLNRGDLEGALADLRASAAPQQAINARNPVYSPWPWPLALALAREDPDEARRLAGAGLDWARRIGLPRGIGIGLRVVASFEQGPSRIRHLEQAVETLARSPARLEEARALVDLGAAMREDGDATRAREPLREGLELAHRCGATRLQERAHRELIAAGARPRRIALSGREALTASQARIADMAAEGMTNAEIAEALFVAPSTVETHLRNAYRKLNVASRAELAAALDETDGRLA